jgi:catechol 2,3-dioxygenase-like lactoylglutathione lyase family enzyme
MDLNHLHFHVKDVAATASYYERWFGFREHVCHGEILFLRNADGFDLALAPDAEGADFPTWFHFGFRLGSAAEVRDLHGRMTLERALVRPLHEDDGYVWFRCADPEGHAIEVYWE